MSNNVTLPGTGAVVETIDIGGGVERQSVTISDRAGSSVDSIGGLTETAPSTDTASSGLNGRLQRIAQHLSSLISALGSPFQAGGSIGNTAFGATQSGSWTVQPGNVANTTAWKVDGSAVTQPVSGALTVNAGTNLNTSALALEAGGNLAILAGAVSGAKVATKAASGDLADGAVTTIGLKADAKSAATDTTAISAMQVWKQISASIQAAAASLAGSISVTGTFWQATQPISAASLPLPTGAATQTTIAAILSALNSPMQNSGGSVTVNAGTNLNTSLLALESGGNLASVVTQLGAVTASPTANTIGDRLKTINATLGAATPAGTNLIGVVKVGDGTNSAAIKAASTAAGATDPAVVVAVSPNNTVPVSIASLPSGAVTNAGTFAVQAAATLNAETTKVIGVVRAADGSGNLLTSTGGALDINIKSGAPSIAPVVSSAAEATHVLKSSAGQVQGVYAVNLTSVPGFLILLNAASAPADGAVTPLAVAPLPPNGATSISGALLNGLAFSTGITAVLTSAATPFTKTTGVITGFISGQVI